MRLALTPGVALRLLEERGRPSARLVAPGRLRSDLLAALRAEVRAGRLARAEAFAQMDHLRALAPRLLTDRVSMRRAWDIADALGCDMAAAEYIAVAALQGDALVVADDAFPAAGTIVAVRGYDALLA
ncbi:hypothetical protein [Frigidibacter sp. MR17.24]|uniref:hypothetical protein n=1 Tax=Frigidibacter sp. MR17.24 TaxID=3127345 RepID=UPI003013118A